MAPTKAISLRTKRAPIGISFSHSVISLEIESYVTYAAARSADS